jgi:hypothetical protein
MRGIAVIFLFLNTGLIHAQEDIYNVDLDRIEQKKVRNLIKQQQNKNISSFSELEVSVGLTDDIAGFYHYEKEYIVKEHIDFVWDSYQLSSQSDIWDLNKISFAMLYSKASGSVTYVNQDCGGLETGQIIYLNLRILNGFYNLPVAFKIVNVNQAKKVIELSYLQGGKARGKQIMRLESTDEGFTRIVHQSMVKSKSKMRDKYLYPYFHNKLINEFHANMRRQIARQVKSGAGLYAVSKPE